MSTAQIGHDLSLAEHPFVARLSGLMAFSASDLENLERIVESERLVKRRQDLVVAGSAYRSLCFVKDGYAIRYKLLRSGKPSRTRWRISKAHRRINLVFH